MSAALDGFQVRLEAHFGALSEKRRTDNLPVFALEHGLTTEDLSSLTSQLSLTLMKGGYRLSKHWLAWVVFSAEQGYDYDGDEYWYTFKQRMPGWDDGWRPSLRSWFAKFHKQYGGLLPVGRWANFFSIIAWPITHALLPKDLQWQLARTLYGLRYSLVARLDQPVGELGRYVARMTHGGSSRYENFLEQEELVGSIILGLLGQRMHDGIAVILPSTLERIVGDLEKARNARQWLHDTRKAVEVARLKGTTRRGADGVSAQCEARPSERKPAIRPTLLLRHTAADEWTPIIEIPSFREVADLSPELDGFLRKTRCAIAGSPGWRPPGWLLTGTQRRVLDTWPAGGRPVLSFQSANAAIDHLLASEACLATGPNSLFRIGSDGQAIEVLGRLIRPGQSYILASSTELPTLSMATTTNIRGRGVTAVRFEVPTALSTTDIAEFKVAELSVAETIRIWPSGLAARGWDGEGATEWLDNESPCFAIQHDHPVAEYEFRLGSTAPVRISAKPPGVPTFIKLQPLPAGNHVLSVSVTRSSSERAIRPVEGLISLRVRPPSPWVSGTIGHSGLLVSCEPSEPTLDEFWEGLTELTVMGPSGRQVTVHVELLDGTGSRLALEQVAQLTLPLGDDSWRQAFSAFARLEKEPWIYLQATSGRIVVDGEDLGVMHLPLQRDVSPVRWVWHNTHRTTRLRLIDHHDSDTPLGLAFYPFGTPHQPISIDFEQAAEGIEPDAPGGLFVATYGDHAETLVVSARKVDGGLHGLLVEPKFAEFDETRDLALDLIKAIRVWSGARLTGTLAAQRRLLVVERLQERLYEVMCGPEWAEAERNYRRGDRSSEACIEGFLTCFERDRTFAFVLARDARKFAHMADNVRQREFAALAQRYKVAPGAISKPALDLADVVQRRLDASDDELAVIIDHLWDRGALTAGARLIHLLGSKNSTAAEVAA